MLALRSRPRDPGSLTRLKFGVKELLLKVSPANISESQETMTSAAGT